MSCAAQRTSTDCAGQLSHRHQPFRKLTSASVAWRWLHSVRADWTPALAKSPDFPWPARTAWHMSASCSLLCQCQLHAVCSFHTVQSRMHECRTETRLCAGLVHWPGSFSHDSLLSCLCLPYVHHNHVLPLSCCTSFMPLALADSGQGMSVNMVIIRRLRKTCLSTRKHQV